MLQTILSLLGDEKIGRVLGIIGAVLVALCAAGWAIFKHIKSREPRQTTETFITLTQYQDLLRAEQTRITEETKASGKTEKEKLRRRQQELTRKLADIEKSYSEALEQNEQLTRRLEELSKFTDRSDFETAAEALRSLRFDDARTYFSKCLDRLSPVLKDAAASHLGMAIACGEKGDWTGAAENFTTALALNEDEYTLGQASKFLWLAGNPTAAIHLSNKLLDRSIARTGRASVDTASVLNLLAGQLYEVGRYDEARSRLTEGLSVLEQLGEAEGARYASSLANLANIHLVEGDLGTAERLLRRALPMLERDQKDEEVALAARNSLAEVLRLKGDNDASLVLMNDNLSKTIESFGRAHPHTARALNFLGKAQLQAGDAKASLRSLLDAFEIQKICLGEFHHNTIGIASNVVHLIDEHPQLSSREVSDQMDMYRKMFEDWAKDVEQSDQEGD